MSIRWDWEPNTRLGPIKLGESIDVYIANLKAFLKDDGKDDDTNWYRYQLSDYDISIDVENNKVVSVTSFSEFIYNGKNIIGENESELVNILGSDADEVGEIVIYDDGDEQTPYEFTALGLQVWVSEHRVVSVSCLKYEN